MDWAYFSSASLWVVWGILILFPAGLMGTTYSALGSLGRSVEDGSWRAERNPAGPLSAIPVKRKRMASLVYSDCVRNPQPSWRLRTSLVDPSAAERRSRVTENWDLNRDQVLLLKQYTQEFPPYQEELERQLIWLEKHSKKINPRDLKMARTVFEGSKQQISSLIQTRLLELGKVDEHATAVAPAKAVSSSSSSSFLDDPNKSQPHPQDLCQLPYIPADLRTKITTHSALLLWEDAKKMLTIHRKIYEDEDLKRQRKPNWPPSLSKLLCSTYGRSTTPINNGHLRFDHLTASKYAFKILDFLFDNQLISLHTLRDFFHDPGLVQLVISYSLARIKSEVGAPYWKSIDHLTAHWYWPSLNKSFSALSKKEELIIDFVFHVGKLKAFIVNLSNGIESTNYFCSDRWAQFSTRFPWRKYFRRLGEGGHQPLSKDASLSRIEDDGHHLGLAPQTSGNESEEDMKQLINQLVTTQHSQGITIPKFILRLYRTETINLFEFINNELYPGIVSELVKNPEFLRILHDSIGLVDQTHEQPKELFYLSLLYSRYHSLQTNTQSYLVFLASKYARKKSSVSFAQQVDEDHILGAYADRFEGLLAHYKKLYDKISSHNSLIIHHLEPEFRQLYLTD